MIFHYRRDDKIHPLVKLLLLIAFCATLSQASLAYTSIAAIFCILVMLVTRLPLKDYLKDLTFFLVLGGLLFLGTWLSSHDLQAASLPALRFLDLILLSMLFADSTDAQRLSDNLGPVLDKIPFVHGYRVAASVRLTLALVPLVFDVSHGTMDAMRSRGGFHKHPVKSLATYTISMANNLLDQTQVMADALDARLFDPDKATHMDRFTRRDFLALLIGAMLVCGGWIR